MTWPKTFGKGLTQLSKRQREKKKKERRERKDLHMRPSLSMENETKNPPLPNPAWVELESREGLNTHHLTSINDGETSLLRHLHHCQVRRKGGLGRRMSEIKEINERSAKGKSRGQGK